MKIEYWFEMPNRWTFKQPKLLNFISKYIPKNSKILIPFAGEFRFGNIDNSEFIYNDIDPKIKANYNINAYKLVWLLKKESFDCIIADPPYSMFAAHRFYRKFKYTPITIWRKAANYLLKSGGVYIELGWNSSGLRKEIAQKIALGICCTGGNHRDILILVQKKYNNIKIEKWV